MFYFDKHDPRVLFGDSRTFSGKLCDGRTFTVEPDEVMDFRNMPFKDESFQLVIFDPPHLRRVGDNSWMKAKYGQLPPDGWKQYLKDGFDECWRVLAPGGTMVFKWNEHQIKIGRIKDCFPAPPPYGVCVQQAHGLRKERRFQRTPRGCSVFRVVCVGERI